MPDCICHFKVNTIKRSAGRSVTAAVAYRTGEKIADQTTGEIFDYTKKRGVEYAEDILPKNINQTYTTSELWNAVESAEKRKNSVVGREYVVAIPYELTAEDRKKLAVEFAATLVEKYGVAANVAIHEPGRGGDDRNYHAHIMTSTRILTQEGFGEKTRVLDTIQTGSEEITQLRHKWADVANTALERVGSDRRLNPLSFADQGLDRIPEIHLGPAATAMERRGERTELGEKNRAIRELNAIPKTGEREIEKWQALIVAAEAEIAEIERSEREDTRSAAVANPWDTLKEIERLAAEAAPEKIYMVPQSDFHQNLRMIAEERLNNYYPAIQGQEYLEEIGEAIAAARGLAEEMAKAAAEARRLFNELPITNSYWKNWKKEEPPKCLMDAEATVERAIEVLEKQEKRLSEAREWLDNSRRLEADRLAREADGKLESDEKLEREKSEAAKRLETVEKTLGDGSTERVQRVQEAKETQQPIGAKEAARSKWGNISERARKQLKSPAFVLSAQSSMIYSGAIIEVGEGYAVQKISDSMAIIHYLDAKITEKFDVGQKIEISYDKNRSVSIGRSETVSHDRDMGKGMER